MKNVLAANSRHPKHFFLLSFVIFNNISYLKVFFVVEKFDSFGFIVGLIAHFVKVTRKTRRTTKENANFGAEMNNKTE